MRKTRILLVLLVLTLSASACMDTGDDGATGSKTPDATTETTGSGATNAVAVKGFLFQPDDLKISKGDTVTWTNNDEILHTATAGTPEAPKTTFDGEMEGPGSKFEHTFEEAGDYPYFCSRHNGMRGTITVT